MNEDKIKGGCVLGAGDIGFYINLRTAQPMNLKFILDVNFVNK